LLHETACPEDSGQGFAAEIFLLDARKDSSGRSDNYHQLGLIYRKLAKSYLRASAFICGKKNDVVEREQLPFFIETTQTVPTASGHAVSVWEL